MKVSILVFLSLSVLVLFLINDSAIIGASYRLAKGEAYLAYPDIISGVQDNVQLAVNNLISPMVLITSLLEQSNIQFKNCNLPLSSNNFYSVFDYTPLIDVLNSLVLQNNTMVQSLGIISANGAGTSNLNATDKVSCEMALNTFNLPCSGYIYACTTGDGGFDGFCAYPNYTVDMSKPIYTGLDYGLTATEAQLFENKGSAVFLPIFNLLGEFSLTYEKSHWCPGDITVYGTSFAEKNLNELNSYLSSLTIGKTGIAYIIEKDTGLLVATTSSNVPLVSNNSRIFSNQSINDLIKSSSRFLQNKGDFSSFTSESYFDPRYDDTNGLLIDIRPCEYPLAQANLNWLSVVVIPESDYTGWTVSNAKWSILVGFFVWLILSIIFLIFIYFTLVKPLKHPNHPTFIAEIQRSRDLLTVR
jgi:hypothetical protein